MNYISFRFMLIMFNLLEEKVKVLKKSTLKFDVILTVHRR